MIFSIINRAFAMAFVSGLGVSGEYALAKRVDSSNALAQRATFVGGWALGGGFDGTCPTNTSQCADLGGTCCPSSSTCTSEGNFGGVACCPSTANCGQTILAIPTCADPTWTLYTARSSYFCCQPGQIGIKEVSGRIVNIVGLCVPEDQVVPTANLASLVGSATQATSATASLSTEAITSLTATPQHSSTTSTVATASATQNAGVSNIVSVGGVLGLSGLSVVQLFL